MRQVELERCRRRGLPDPLFPADDPAFAHEAPEELGEATPRARVLHPHGRAVVGSDADQRVGHDRHDVVVVHTVLHDHGAGILREERADRRERIERSVGRDIFDRSADRRQVDVRDDHGVHGRRRPPGARRQLPAERLRLGTPALELLDPALGRGRRQQGHQERRAGGIRVLVAPDVDTCESRPVERVEQQPALAFVLRSERLAVRDLHPCPRTAPDLDRFIERLAEPLAFVPHVGRVRPAPSSRDPGERHDLVGRCVCSRNVDQPGREPDRPRVERLFGERAHRDERALRELATRAVGRETERPVADERGDIVRRSGRAHPGQVVGEAPCIDRHTGEQVAPRFLRVGRGRAVERRDGEPTVPDDLGRHALQQLERLRLGHQRERVGMRMRVDEPRRDEPLPGVDRPSRGADVTVDRHHTVPVDRDVRGPPRRAQPIVNDPSGDHQVVHHRDATCPWASRADRMTTRRSLAPVRAGGRSARMRASPDPFRPTIHDRGPWPNSASSPSGPSSGSRRNGEGSP